MNTITIRLALILILAAGALGCEDVNPVGPSVEGGHAVTRSGAGVEPCADPVNRRKPC